MAAVDEFELAEASPDGEAPSPVSARPGRGRPWGWVLAALALIGWGSAGTEAIPAMIGQGNGVDLRILDLDIRQAPELMWELPASYAYLATISDGVAVAMDYDGTVSAVGIDLMTGAER